MASTTAAPKMPRFAVIARFLPAGSCGIGPVLPAGETIARQWRQVPGGGRRDARSVALLTTANGARPSPWARRQTSPDRSDSGHAAWRRERLKVAPLLIIDPTQGSSATMADGHSIE